MSANLNNKLEDWGWYTQIISSSCSIWKDLCYQFSYTLWELYKIPLAEIRYDICPVSWYLLWLYILEESVIPMANHSDLRDKILNFQASCSSINLVSNSAKTNLSLLFFLYSLTKAIYPPLKLILVIYYLFKILRIILPFNENIKIFMISWKLYIFLFFF